jgi:hypothetical protein
MLMKISTSFVATAVLLFLGATAASTRQNTDVLGKTTAREERNQGRLVLTEDEKMVVRHEVYMRATSTMDLGALFAGGNVPLKVEAQNFPKTVVRKVPQLTGYKYITAETFVAVIDPQAFKVQLVIEDHY